MKVFNKFLIAIALASLNFILYKNFCRPAYFYYESLFLIIIVVNLWGKLTVANNTIATLVKFINVEMEIKDYSNKILLILRGSNEK